MRRQIRLCRWETRLLSAHIIMRICVNEASSQNLVRGRPLYILGMICYLPTVTFEPLLSRQS